jgi:hypothetical protein
MFYGSLTGFGGGGGISYEGLMGDIATAGLLSNLELCIDVAAASCYDSGVDSQTLFDMSGNGNDFHFGADDSATTDDPTFNGSVGGLSASEYITFDGGDWFNMKAASAAMNLFHQNNADFTILDVWYLSNLGAGVGCYGNSSSNNGGFYQSWESNEKWQHNIKKGTGQTALYFQSTSGQFSTLPGWKAIALSLDEAGGGTASFYRRTDADAQEAYLPVDAGSTWDGAYSSPEAADPGYHYQIGATGNNLIPCGSGMRFACQAIWSESLTTAQIDPLLQSASISTRYSL